MTHFFFFIFLVWLWLPISLCFSAGAPFKVESARIETTNSNGGLNGHLIFLGGFELASRDPRFGGLSGLVLSKDGNRLYAISDRGYWLTARLHHDSQGVLQGLDSWQIASLLNPSGSVLKGSMRDAEALVRDRDGSFIVGFERNPRLWRYPLPADLKKAPSNGGLEAVAILPDRRFVMITERYKNENGTTKGWLMDRNRFSSISYLQSDGFQPTDISPLPNGDLLLLERRYNLLRGAIVRVRRLPATGIRPGARLKGEELALLEPPFEVDNFEGHSRDASLHDLRRQLQPPSAHPPVAISFNQGYSITGPSTENFPTKGVKDGRRGNRTEKTVGDESRRDP
jgi:hypothetical protein